METWLDALNTSPLPVLLNAQDKALDYFVRRDLLRETAGRLKRSGISLKRTA